MSNPGGRFVWYELATTDTEAAKAFYSDVLGWGTGEASAPGSLYTLFTAQGTPVAGLTKLPAEALKIGVAPLWTGYVAVGDVDATARKVELLGGTVQVPPRDLPNVSRFSVIADSEMATLIVVRGQRGGQHRSASVGVRGRVSWHELLAFDVERELSFYRDLFGWQKMESQAGPHGTYQHFSDGTETIGGVGVRPAVWSRSLWLYYFNVAGIDAAAKRVVAGGGQVLVGPFSVSNGTQVLQCRDPQGALFALLDTRVSIKVACYAPRDRRNA